MIRCQSAQLAVARTVGCRPSWSESDRRQARAIVAPRCRWHQWVKPLTWAVAGGRGPPVGMEHGRGRRRGLGHLDVLSAPSYCRRFDSGTGRTHLPIGLAVAACEAGRRIRYVTAAALVDERVWAEDTPSAVTWRIPHAWCGPTTVLDEPSQLPTFMAPSRRSATDHASLLRNMPPSEIRTPGSRRPARRRVTRQGGRALRRAGRGSGCCTCCYTSP